MKIGLITLTGYYNYGNRLQNYASQYILEKLGHEVETIEMDNKLNFINYMKVKILIFFAKIYDKIPYSNNKRLNSYLVYNKFYLFTKKYINISKFKINHKDIPKNINDYFDYFVTGSDQVWNPKASKIISNYFLDFSHKGKRVSYAASFGVSSIPTEYKNEYIRLINQMDSISVREEQGQQIIKELTGKNSTLVVDPTMMLSKDEWLRISKKPNMDLSEKFILTYFLGNRDLRVQQKIEHIAKEKGFKIINLMDINDKKIYSIDPSEFIFLINECELLCTDSFHGAVFSLIMKTPFIVFERQDHNESMNSRLETLLKKFNMEDRFEKNIKNAYDVNFDNIDQILNREREKAINYLENSFR